MVVAIQMCIVFLLQYMDKQSLGYASVSHDNVDGGRISVPRKSLLWVSKTNIF